MSAAPGSQSRRRRARGSKFLTWKDVDDSAYSLSGRKLQVRVRCGGCFGVGSSFNGDEIADNIIEGVDQCGTPGGANGKSLGVVTFNPGPNLAYTMWLGNICGQLGFGDGRTCC
jgi:hypothetical protein